MQFTHCKERMKGHLPGIRQRRTLRLHVEHLERRLVLSAASNPIGEFAGADGLTFEPVIVAGDPDGTPADSPDDRIDPNDVMSDYAGVGSLFMQLGGFNGFICTGTLIDAQHVLTAGHCLDHNNNGSIDFDPSDVTFNLNYGGDLTHSIEASALFIHPDFDGFNKPRGNVHDDIAVIELAEPVPGGVPTYDLYTDPIMLGDALSLVGYGQSGDGVDGYYVDASFSVKRVGGNEVDVLEPDDEGGAEDEVYMFDFDGPSGNGPLGSDSLGNAIETTLGGGDSGGPGLVAMGNTLLVATVNTFTVSGGEFANAPLFGSGGGGIIVAPYAGWIADVLTGNGGGGNDGGGGGGGGGGGRPGCHPVFGCGVLTGRLGQTDLPPEPAVIGASVEARESSAAPPTKEVDSQAASVEFHHSVAWTLESPQSERTTSKAWDRSLVGANEEDGGAKDRLFATLDWLDPFWTSFAVDSLT